MRAQDGQRWRWETAEEFEEAARRTEETARQAAEAKAAELEVELKRLRAQLESKERREEGTGENGEALTAGDLQRAVNTNG